MLYCRLPAGGDNGAVIYAVKLRHRAMGEAMSPFDDLLGYAGEGLHAHHGFDLLWAALLINRRLGFEVKRHILHGFAQQGGGVGRALYSGGGVQTAALHK